MQHPIVAGALMLALALATGADAQTTASSSGFDDALTAGSPEPLPEPYYVETLMGRYAAPGRCDSDRVEDLMVVTAVGVQIGDVLCEGIGKRHWEDGWMHVPLSICRIDRRDQGDRTLRLRRLTGGDLGVRSDAENPVLPNEVMQRCGS